MEYYTIIPQIAGHFGPETRITHEQYPPTVHELHYEFEDWPEDDVLKSFPCYIVSDKLQNTLSTSDLTGFDFDDVIVSKDIGLADREPDRELPDYYWFQITGDPGQHDFGLKEKSTLIISEAARTLLKGFSTEYARIEPYDGG